jgi:hypothetical protein
MIAGDGASGKVGTSFWPYGRRFDIQTATDGQIESDFSLSGQTSPFVIRSPFLRRLPGLIGAIHRSAAGFPGIDLGARELLPSGT